MPYSIYLIIEVNVSPFASSECVLIWWKICFSPFHRILKYFALLLCLLIMLLSAVGSFVVNFSLDPRLFSLKKELLNLVSHNALTEKRRLSGWGNLKNLILAPLSVSQLWIIIFVNVLFQDLLEALNQLEEGLRANIKLLSSFDKYKQEVLLGHLDWSPMHKDPLFWRDNITNFEDNDFQVFCVAF